MGDRPKNLPPRPSPSPTAAKAPARAAAHERTAELEALLTQVADEIARLQRRERAHEVDRNETLARVQAMLAKAALPGERSHPDRDGDVVDISEVAELLEPPR